jgi:hypothetical protein
MIFHWLLMARSGVAGFQIYSGSHRLDKRLIAVHHSPSYAFKVRTRATGLFSLRCVLTNGNFVVVMFRP